MKARKTMTENGISWVTSTRTRPNKVLYMFSH